MQKIDIVTMEIKDVPEAAALEKLYFTSPWSEKALMETINNPLSYFLCAKHEDKLIGYAGMYSANSEGYMCNIVVDKSFRGKKIGTSLLIGLLNYSKNMQLKFLSLEVRKSNKIAINFYKKLGFEIQGIRKNFYSLPQEDALIMTIYLYS